MSSLPSGRRSVPSQQGQLEAETSGEEPGGPPLLSVTYALTFEPSVIRNMVDEQPLKERSPKARRLPGPNGAHIHDADGA